MSEWDLIILGGGPAGLTAGIYGARSGLRTLLIEAKLPGGQVAVAPMVENYPGFPEGIRGAELVEKMTEQANKFGVEIKSMEPVVGISVSEEEKSITTKKGNYKAKAVIIATGAKSIDLQERLDVKGEDKFIGKGISYCATCDGRLFKDKKVAIVGNTSETASEALYLASLCSEVNLITTGKIDADEALLKELHKKVKIWNARIKAIKGKKMVESITIEENGKERILDVSCIFIALGKKAPGSEMFKKAGVNVDEKGFVVVDRFQRTNIEGVYAAGDITGGFFQISKAIGEGAIAAMHARKYIKKKGGIKIVKELAKS